MTDKELIADLLAALEQAELQIVYLHERFKPTGSGNAVLAHIRDAISKAEGRT